MEMQQSRQPEEVNHKVIQNLSGANNSDILFQAKLRSKIRARTGPPIKKKQTDVKSMIRKLLISIPYQIVITILTVYSLVADDIRIIAFQKDADVYFDAVNIFLICIFSVQILLSSIAVDKYFLSFFFVLDIISTLSFFFDVSIFTNLIYASNSDNYSFSQVAAQSKASRAAIRAVRIVKLFRIIRIVKLYKSALKAQQIQESNKRQRQMKQKMMQKFQKNQNKKKQKREALIAAINKHSAQKKQQKQQQQKLKLIQQSGPEQSAVSLQTHNQGELSNVNSENENQSKNQVVGSSKSGPNDSHSKGKNTRVFPEQMIIRVKQPNDSLNPKPARQSTFLAQMVQPATPVLTKQSSRRTSGMYQDDMNDMFETEIIDQINNDESKIRKVMGDNTLKKVIVVVLTLMFLVPMFDSEVYTDKAFSFQYTVNNVNYLLENKDNVPLTVINDVIEDVLNDHKDQENYLIYFSTPFKELPYYQHSDFFSTRISDFVASTYVINTASLMALRPTLTLRGNFTDDIESTNILAIMNQKNSNKNQSYLSLARTMFVCLVLIILLHFFNSDIEELIVHPIEQMMQKLKSMAEDPQSASKEQIQPNAHLQTTIVSNAIIKIGALLSIVFGSAGAEIIGKNIVQEGDMNPMLEGQKKCAIFGFCDIRKFTEINEILQEDILLFVNKISSIVHKAVYRYGGSANKNIGEAFLLVWKIPDKDYEINNSNNEITWHNKETLSVQADFAVFSFIKCLIKINKSPEILEYRNDYRLLEKLPEYKVEMGFGLHIGWAIEGAIGSEFKIDASYLSPNVNMASRLEAATKQFGLDLLISQSLYDLLSSGLKKYCRNIDRVTVKGSNKPLKLYTIDLNLEKISAPSDKRQKYPEIMNYQPDIELKRDMNLKFMSKEYLNIYNAENFIDSKKELRQVMVNAVPTEFRSRFDLGLQSYLKGKWADAKMHNDGPTKRLISYMKNYDFVAPPTWDNYRELTSK